MRSWVACRRCLRMVLIAFQAGSRMTSHPIASSGEPGGGGGGAEDVERCTLIHPPSYTESYHHAETMEDS